MIGTVSILLLLFVTGVLLLAGLSSIVLGMLKNRNRQVFLVRGTVLSVICLVLLGLVYVFTDSFAALAVAFR